MKGVISMSGRKMYSTELKLEIVQRYLRGDIGIKKMADEYHISSKACIQKWLGQGIFLSNPCIQISTCWIPQNPNSFSYRPCLMIYP